MAKFKVGDRVQRIAGRVGGMQPGAVGTVSEAAFAEFGMKISGFVGRHDPKNFVMHEAAPPGYETLSVLVDPAPPVCGEADPNGIPANAPGAKLDAGKLRPTLVLRDMARALTAVVKIASDGAVKYTPGGWLQVPNGLERYEDASLRHMLTRFAGKPVDDLSGSLHLAHEAWNALAKLELALREEERRNATTGTPV